MTRLKNATTHVLYKDPEHKYCCNQVNIRQASNGDVLAVFNEERYPFHHDSGQTVFIRSTDGGRSWDAEERVVVLPWDERTGNWDCGLLEMQDGTLLINLCLTGHFKRGVKSSGVSWASGPVTEEWGDWTWSYTMKSWLGTFVTKSTDHGKTWGELIPVNVRPMKHGGTRLGCWQLPDGGLYMGVYGRIHDFGFRGGLESNRAALIRSDDNGENWEYYSTLAYDPASIIDYTESSFIRLDDGRMVAMLRTSTRPSSDPKNIAMVVSEDGGFSWSQPKFTNIWGYPTELLKLQDGRILMVYGHRRPTYGVRGCISEDGVTWDIANEFIISEGGIPGEVEEKVATDVPTHQPSSALKVAGSINPNHPGLFQHIAYPSVAQLNDGTIICGYHEWSNDPQPLQYVLCKRFELED